MYEDFTQELKDERAQKKRKARARKVEEDRKPARDAPRGMPLWRKIVLGAIFVFAAFSVLIMSAVINSADDYSPQEQINTAIFTKKETKFTPSWWARAILRYRARMRRAFGFWISAPATAPTSRRIKTPYIAEISR